MLYLLLLWLILEIISLIFLPVSLRLFRSLDDHGYAFNKSLSLLVTAFSAWFLISLKVFPFTQTTLILVLLPTLVIASLALRDVAIHIDRKRLLYIIFIEILFFAILAFTSYLKYRTSPISGTEKPMDFALINGIFRSEYFPPNDAWYAGKTINYYYFGHYIFAFLSKLSTIPTQIIYTLALPLVFSLTSVNIFGLVFNSLKKKKTAIIFGLFAIGLILFGSNFDTPLQLIKSLLSHTPITISWWDPSRIIGRGYLPNGGYTTITEFPYFSLLLGDVHAHVIALFLSSLFLGLIFAFFTSPSTPILLAGSLTLSALAMTNPWELPFYLLLALVVLSLRGALPRGNLYKWPPLLVASFLFFIFPFLAHFRMILPVNDPKFFIYPILDPALIGRHTLFSEFITIWGTHLILLVIAWSIPSLRAKRGNLVLSLVGLAILIFCEFFFINDFFTAPYERMNTIFKLYYQAWLILGISGFILFGLVWGKFTRKIKLIIAPILCLLLAGNLTYFLVATPVRLNEFSTNSWSFDGLKYLSVGSDDDRGELAAINWFNQNVTGSVNIAESIVDPVAGNSYSQIGRISAATGLPTILGWYAVNHEAGWRNNSPDVYVRVADVSQAYLSPNLDLVGSLLRKYQIKYIYVGPLERVAYPQANFNKFSQLGKLVFSQGSSQIYKIK